MDNLKGSHIYNGYSDSLDIESDFVDILKQLLNTVSLSNTSNGVLCKWVSEFKGVNYYFKSGSLNSIGYFSNRQPYSEIMAYRIGKQLGFPNLVKTFITEIDFKETETYLEQKAVVSYTKDFKPNSNATYKGIHYYVDDLEIKKNYNNLYKFFTCKFKEYKIDIDIMILFDFIIANTDRHLNNFGLIENGSEILFSPMFDNGLSLLSNLSDNELEKISEFALKKYLKSKPFSSDPKKQLKLIDLKSIPNNLVKSILHHKLDWDDIFFGLELSDMRKDKIIELVEGRLEYVKDLLFEIL